MMSEFECAASPECGRICDALALHGITRGNDRDDSCTIPELFDTSNDEIKVTLPEDLSERDAKLATALFESLYPLIHEKDPLAPDVERLKTNYQEVLETRMALWQSMGDSIQSKRDFTDVELHFYEAEITAKQNELNEIGNNVSSEVLLRGQAAFDHGTLEKWSIVFDEQAINVLDRLAVNGMDAKSTLLIGDKGIAKTQLALFMGKFMSGDKEPVFLSGHGDQTADEFIGRDYQDPKTGLFVFKHGKLIEAARKGLPVVIDEINLADQSITMRLQHILLLKPGDKIVVHENGNEEIEIAPGFVVFATANEASERYRHRVVLDPAFRDRFDIINLYYPDRDNDQPMLGVPATTFRLAFAAASNADGTISKHVTAREIDALVRVAHVTQRLYSTPLEDAGNLGDLDIDTNTSQYLSSDKPPMTDCITPRTMVNILRRCAPGNKTGMTVAGELKKTIESMDQGGSRINSSYANKVLEFYEASAAA